MVEAVLLRPDAFTLAALHEAGMLVVMVMVMVGLRKTNLSAVGRVMLCLAGPGGCPQLDVGGGKPVAKCWRRLRKKIVDRGKRHGEVLCGEVFWLPADWRGTAYAMCGA